MALMAFTSCSGDEPLLPDAGSPTRSADAAQPGSAVLTVDDAWADERHVNFDDEPGDTLRLTLPNNPDGAPTADVNDAV